MIVIICWPSHPVIAARCAAQGNLIRSPYCEGVGRTHWRRLHQHRANRGRCERCVRVAQFRCVSVRLRWCVSLCEGAFNCLLKHAARAQTN
jgi:hypothetical protein